MYILTSVILLELIIEGSKNDSKSTEARGEKNGAHSQVPGCANVKGWQVRSKMESKLRFLILLQVRKKEIYYEESGLRLHL